MKIMVVGRRRPRARDHPQAARKPRGDGDLRASRKRRHRGGRGLRRHCGDGRRRHRPLRRRTREIDFAVVAPDDPLAMGAVDALHAKGVACFGPDAKAAKIESSKAFAKELMRKYGIPTAKFRVFSDAQPALEYVRTGAMPDRRQGRRPRAGARACAHLQDERRGRGGRARHDARGGRFGRKRRDGRRGRNASRGRRCRCSRSRTAMSCARWSPRWITSARTTATRG